MGKHNKQRRRGGIGEFKHETPQERQERHERDVTASRARTRPVFDVVAGDRLHTEAEEQTLQLGPRQHGRSGRV